MYAYSIILLGLTIFLKLFVQNSVLKINPLHAIFLAYNLIVFELKLLKNMRLSPIVVMTIILRKVICFSVKKIEFLINILSKSRIYSRNSTIFHRINLSFSDKSRTKTITGNHQMLSTVIMFRKISFPKFQTV
jgi:hypothetical protein